MATFYPFQVSKRIESIHDRTNRTFRTVLVFTGDDVIDIHGRLSSLVGDFFELIAWLGVDAFLFQPCQRVVERKTGF